MRGGGGTSSSHDDAVLSRLYQQVGEAREPRFAAGYDLEAGLDRYRAWLREHSETAAGRLAAAEATAPDAFVTAPAERTEWSADLAVIEMYSMHYPALVRLAAMLVRDTPTAEEVVQDAFIAMHDAWDRLRDTDKALAYMRQAVVNRSRSVLRHRLVVEKNHAETAARHAERRSGRADLARAVRRRRRTPRPARTPAGGASSCGTTRTCPRLRSRPPCISAVVR